MIISKPKLKLKHSKCVYKGLFSETKWFLWLKLSSIISLVVCCLCALKNLELTSYDLLGTKCILDCSYSSVRLDSVTIITTMCKSRVCDLRLLLLYFQQCWFPLCFSVQILELLFLLSLTLSK